MFHAIKSPHSRITRAGFLIWCIRRCTLDFVVNDLFLKGGDVSTAEFWTGLRPMTPDCTLTLGEIRYNNLFLSTGHGTLGWSMAAGTGRVMANLLGGRKPDISMQGLNVTPYAPTPRLARPSNTSPVWRFPLQVLDAAYIGGLAAVSSAIIECRTSIT